VKCSICANNCSVPLNEIGYCGLRKNENARLVHLGGLPSIGIAEWYYDPLPTNCVADPFCAGGCGAGYPKFAYKNGPEYGYKNLAVFYEACTFNCLFCQNWHYRYGVKKLQPVISAEALASKADVKTACICYFGGDPTPQILHALKTSEIAIELNKNRILRICWESNGSVNEKYLKKMADLSLSSGGCIKFDLKAWDEKLHRALCGVSNKQTLGNFEKLVEHTYTRDTPPFLVASTLLVPGYVDVDEVSKIAKFIAQLNPRIPYNLLAFHPQFYMSDMPITTRKHAERCLVSAKSAGLENVRIGNIHLLA
jgi:pyruvate formate lyase activating enzyme